MTPRSSLQEGLREPDVRPNFVPMDAGGTELRLAMQSLFLTGKILPVGARLFVSHTFESAEENPLEVIYAFMLPRDGALRRFRIVGRDFAAISELRPVQEARESYEEGIRSGHLAAMVQQYRDGYVNLNLGNLRPGERITVHLEVLAGVDLTDRGLRFRFPFAVAPCYHGGMRTHLSEEGRGEWELPEDEFGDLVLPPFMKDAKGLHRVGFDLVATAAGKLAEVSSPSHAVSVQPLDENRVRVQLAPEHDLPNRDLVLDVRSREAAGGFIGGPSRDGGSAFSLVIPSTEFGEVPSGARRMVFVLDRSGSMSGRPMKQARRGVLACIGALRGEDEVGLVAFDDRIELFRDHMALADGGTREDLRGFVDSVDARGGTELLTAIEAASGLLGRDGGDILVLTDGQVAGTDTIVGAARKLGIRIHCLGIGSTSQDRFLNLLTTETGGVGQFVTPKERVDKAALKLFASIGRPVAGDVAVELADPTRGRIAPEPPRVVYGGYPLLVFGECREGDCSLVVRWNKDDQPKRMELPLALGSGTDGTTVRLLRGARLIVQAESRLGLQGFVGAADRRQQKRVEHLLEELSKEYGLTSSRMALVAVVRREGDQAGRLPETRVVPVGMAEDVEFEAYFSAGALMDLSLSEEMSPEPAEARACAPPSPFPTPPVARPKMPRAAPGRARKRLEPIDVAMEVAQRIGPDGGMPGDREWDRVAASAVAILCLAAVEEGEELFAAHMERLATYIEQAVDGAAPGSQERELIRKTLQAAESGDALPEKIFSLAEELILEGRLSTPDACSRLEKMLRQV